MSFYNGTWSTLLIGPDVGSLLVPEFLEPGQSVQFAFRLGASGKMRLQLKERLPVKIWICHAVPKGAKRVTSAGFTVE